MTDTTEMVTSASQNIFEDIGFDAAEALSLKIRADLMLDLKAYIHNRNWTQTQTSEFFQLTPIQIQHLTEGEINSFTIDQLIRLLFLAGKEVKIEIISKAA